MAIATQSAVCPHEVAKPDRAKYRCAQGLLLLLGVCFLLQVFSPLRLNTDAITLLSMGDSAAHGGGFLKDGQKTVFPPGYPALLAILLRLGFAHPWVIAGLNMVSLSVGLLAAYSVLTCEFFHDRLLVIMICSFFLLSYVVIKHSTIPLTDVPFFCLSMSAVAVMNRARNANSNWRLGFALGGASLLAVAAMMVRTVGAALFPPLILTIVGGSGFLSWLKGLPLRAKVLIAAGGAFVTGVCAVMLATTPYWRFYRGGGKAGVFSLILENISRRLGELGELFSNFPTWKLPARVWFMVPWLGLLLLVLVLLGLATRLRKIGPADVFLVCYMGALAAWPFRDARYLLPVIPLLSAYTVLGVRYVRFPRSVIAVYCVVYAALGFGAIAYSSRITFAGCKFPDRYGDSNLASSLRETYRAASRSCPGRADPSKVDAKVLHLLQEYK